MTPKPRMKPNAAERATWQSVLTPEESATVLAADAARAKWEALAPQRAFIVNRAIQRARYRNGAR